jgi:hypothetical protein
VVGRDHNEKIFSVNIPSILHGVLVDAGSLRIKEQPFPVISNPLRTSGFHERTGSFLDGYLLFQNFENHGL